MRRRELAGSLLLRNARVWAHPDASVTAPRDLLLHDGWIWPPGVPAARVGADKVLDLAGRVVTAGFWNCHVHLTEPVWTGVDGSVPGAGAAGSGAEESDGGAVQRALDDMLLRRGITTAVDLASDPRTTTALIRAIASGELRGPEIMTAGAGIRPWRGMPYYVKDTIPLLVRALMPSPPTPAGARRVVAMQERRGATVIKLFTGSYVAPGRVRTMRLSVARAACREARRRGVRVFAHPSDRKGTRIAIEAGVDALAHLPDQPDGTEPLLREAAARGIHVVPTLHMFAATVSDEEEYLAPIRSALRAFRRAGGQVLFGTDVGYMSDRASLPEFRAMEVSGMSTAEILCTLTTAPSAFFGHDHQGAVEPGKRADLTVLETTSSVPTPADLAQVHAVIKGGRRVYPE